MVANDLSTLRRGDHTAERLRIERERLELLRTSSETAKEKEFRQWLQRPEIRAELFPDLTRGLTAETLAKIERELRLL